jgi:antitoxin (DNA-binding transcriptional repressor) of toxin-antitoxin stability system
MGMKILTIRDFRTRPAAVRRDLAREPQAMLTAHGRPFALVTPVTSENADEVAGALRQARAQLALRALRRQAKADGTDRLSLVDIDRIIADERAGRRAANRRTGR